MSRRLRRWHDGRLRLLAVPVAAIALLCPLVTTAGADPWPRQVPLDQLSVTTNQIASGLTRPTSIAGAADGGLLITEQVGTVRSYDPDGGLAQDPVLDLSDRVNDDGNEQGLLGLVPARDFAESGLVYVTYTAADGALTLSAVPLGDPGAEQVLLSQQHGDFANHNGGQLAFGADGYLYWGLGDGGGGGDPLDNGQDLGTVLGTIVRLDVGESCDQAYCVPPDNPFVDDDSARSEIWSYGLRNPWRFSFDAADGSLWIGDVGQGSKEEIDHLAADAGGVNLGWSCMEGTEVFDESRCDPDADYTDPVFEYDTADGCAVIGGSVYRGERHADLADGTYVATDYCSGDAYAVRATGDGSYESAVIGSFPSQVSSFGTDAAGELYVVDDQAGQLYEVGFEQVA